MRYEPPLRNKAQEFKVGDFARNIESGWLGKIVEILPPERVWIDRVGGFYFMETNANMVGVDEIVVIVSGQSWEDSLSTNDTQQHALSDLVRATDQNLSKR